MGINRSSFYYEKRENTLKQKKDEILQKEIEKLYLRYPYYGVRRMKAALNNLGFKVGLKLVRRLMKELGIEAIYPKPNLSKSNKEHKKYPYLLDKLEITHPNNVWVSDITHIKLPGGKAYLVTVLDLYSRKVLSWKVSNSIESNLCVECLENALNKFVKPEIFNTDQGSQYTSNAFTEKLKEYKIQISMDGKGRVFDNIKQERLWRTVKYEDIFINGYMSMNELKKGLECYFKIYNAERLHQNLGYQTPDEIYFEKPVNEGNLMAA